MKRLVAAVALVVTTTVAPLPTVMHSDAIGSTCGGYCTGSASPPDAVVLICPQGDTPSLSDLGVTLSIPFGGPVPTGTIHAGEACGTIRFCTVPLVDGPPDAGGTATFSGAIAGGGQTDSWLWYTGYIPEPPCLVVEVPVHIKSPDINGDLVVDKLDFTIFGNAWEILGQPYDVRADMDGNGVINTVDFSKFGQHYGHHCE